MLSRFVSSTIEKLSIKESKASPDPSPEALYPTISLPPPPPAGTGSLSLCPRCLTLLSHIITRFGDGTGYDALAIPHSSSLSDLSGGNQKSTQKNKSSESENTFNTSSPLCVICIKILTLFNAARAHTAFETSLRNTPLKDWSLSWGVDAPDPKVYPQFAFPHDSLRILMSVYHKGGYGWGIGGFKIYPDLGVISGSSAAVNNDEQKKDNLGDYPIIVSLDPTRGSALLDKNDEKSYLDFSSTLGIEIQALIMSWAKECATSHQKCNKIFGSDGLLAPAAGWFPDRLIRITSTKTTETTEISSGEEVTLIARVVIKSNPMDFPPHKLTAGGINYLSLSHCWGPAPDPSAPLGGRAGTVLTQKTLPDWQEDLPLDDLPLTFQHAIMACVALGFEHIWIDSLCILQDSIDDWRAQSAVMGDVYKFAWLNVAALSTASDSEGFINDSRDVRVEFGFRAPFASILGRQQGERNGDGQECVLLRGRAKLLWNFSADVPGSSASNAKLFERAWVYQERSLARRMLGFTNTAVYWACDETSRGEQPEWGGGGLAPTGLRGTSHSVGDTALALAARINAGRQLQAQERRTILREHSLTLMQGFDMRWHSCVTSYTLCKLTKHSDKLIAVASVARELASTQILKKRYLAGLWDVNLPSQMAWITVHGRTTPPRKRVGDAEYVAPSWSWASVEAPVQPRFMFNSGNGLVALADVCAADVALETDFAFGFVKAGWLRVRGHLRRVKAGERKAFYSWDKGTRSTSLTDEVTGEKLWFCADTVEGYKLVESGKGIEKLVWMPLTLRFGTNMIDCICLCLMEVEAEAEIGGNEKGFIKPGEQVYRRVGTGNFGRIPSMLRQDKLLVELGVYPDVQVADGQGQILANGFKRNEDGLREFVLI